MQPVRDPKDPGRLKSIGIHKLTPRRCEVCGGVVTLQISYRDPENPGPLSRDGQFRLPTLQRDSCDAHAPIVTYKLMLEIGLITPAIQEPESKELTHAH